MFLDTLACAFAGRRELFQKSHGEDGQVSRGELSLANNWDWSKKNRVLRFDLSEGRLFSRGELVVKLKALLGVRRKSTMLCSKRKRFRDVSLN